MVTAEHLREITQVLRSDLFLSLPTIADSDPTLAPTVAHETNAHPEQGYDRLDIIEDWQYKVATAHNPEKPLFFILDLDENLFDTVGFWITETNRLLMEEHSIPADRLPTVAEVLAEGGPSSYYPNHFPEIWSKAESDGTGWHPHTDPGSYENLAERWRHDEAGNSKPPLLEGLEPATLMSTFARHGQVLGGLTARPATIRVINATHEQTITAGFEAPPSDRPVNKWTLPIIFKPKAVQLHQSGTEKLSVISQILPESNQNARVVLLDDSLSTARVIAEHNQSAAPHRKISYILNAMGPLTAPKMEGDHPRDPGLATQLTAEHGIFVLTSWDSMDEVLTKIQAWHSQNSSS